MENVDKKIARLVKEVKKIKKTKSELSHDEIKVLLKDQGGDDELDMAIVMAEVEPVDWKRLIIKTSIVVGLILMFFTMIDLIGSIINFYLIGWTWYMFVIVLAVVIVIGQNIAHRKKYLNEMINHDFGFKVLTKHEAGDYLAKIEGVPADAQAKQILKCTFDGRETYFGYFQWERGGRKNRQINYRTFVIQLIEKQFDPIMIQPHMIEGWVFAGEDVHLESNDFNDQFIVKTGGNPKNAFYTLNPRVMEQILNEYKEYNFNFMQIKDNLVILGYDESVAEMSLSVKFDQPLITFTEYNEKKQMVLQKLDVVSNIADVLQRETIDEDGIRNQAEQK